MKCPHMTPFLQSIQEWDWKFHTSYTWFYECEVKKKDECSIRRENDHWSLVSMQEVIQHDLTLTFIFAELLSAHISSIQHYQPNYTSHVSCHLNAFLTIIPIMFHLWWHHTSKSMHFISSQTKSSAFKPICSSKCQSSTAFWVAESTIPHFR